MGTFLYSPGVRVFVQTIKHGHLEVTKDLVSGRLMRYTAQSSTFDFSLMNDRRKYEGVFTPNDRVSVRMKRLKWVQVFTGYMNSVPYISAYSRTVPLSAECTLKRLRFRYWDPGTAASVMLIHNEDDPQRADQELRDADGGMRNKSIKLLTEVAGWPEEAIHIGQLPQKWFDRIQPLWDRVSTELRLPPDFLGQSAVSGSDAVGGIDRPATNEADVDKFLYGLRTHESGGNYQARSAVSSASGAYQYIDRTWAGYGGFLRAYQAPPTVQDARARRDSLAAFAKFGSWQAVAVNHFFPKWADKPHLWDQVPKDSKGRPLPGNPPVNKFVDSVMDKAGITGGASGLASGGGGPRMKDTTDPQRRGMVPPIAGATWLGQGTGKYGSYPETDWHASRGGGSRKHIGIDLMAPTGSPVVSMTNGTVVRAGVGGGGIGIRVWVKADEGDLYFLYGHNSSNTVSEGDRVQAGQRIGYVGSTGNASASSPHVHMQIHRGGMGSDKVIQPHPFVAAAEEGGAAPLPGAGGGLGTTGGFLNIHWWTGKPDYESEVLAGARALMNDEPVLTTVRKMLGASMRTFQSAPNGDFISWFPDYFDLYGITGKMIVRSIEVEDFTIVWNDERLKTHMFTSGAAYNGPFTLGGDAANIVQRVNTMGVVSVEFPEVLEALLNVHPDDEMVWSDAQEFLARFGARPHYEPMGTISGEQAEFWYACKLFTENWAKQFSATAPLTFMPELYPGMILQLPDQGFQAYIDSVSHTFDFEGGGFRTSAGIVAPSALDNSGLHGLPRGGPQSVVVTPEPKLPPRLKDMPTGGVW